MMYRCGWGKKENQENILAIDMKRNAFDFLVQNAIMSTYKEDMGISYAEWKEQIKKSDIRCQWDPERDVFGNPLKYRSIQLGLRGEAVKKFVNEWIVNISDVTDYVKELSKKKNSGEDISLLLPKEKIYIVQMYVRITIFIPTLKNNYDGNKVDFIEVNLHVGDY